MKNSQKEFFYNYSSSAEGIRSLIYIKKLIVALSRNLSYLYVVFTLDDKCKTYKLKFEVTYLMRRRKILTITFLRRMSTAPTLLLTWVAAEAAEARRRRLLDATKNVPFFSLNDDVMRCIIETLLDEDITNMSYVCNTLHEQTFNFKDRMCKWTLATNVNEVEIKFVKFRNEFPDKKLVIRGDIPYTHLKKIFFSWYDFQNNIIRHRFQKICNITKYFYSHGNDFTDTCGRIQTNFRYKTRSRMHRYNDDTHYVLLKKLSLKNCPNGLILETEEAYAVFGNLGLHSIELKKGVKVIDPYSFYNCPYLKSVIFPRSVSEIGRFAFARSGLKLLRLQGVKSVKERAFSNCKDLQSVTFSRSVSELGKHSFSYTGITAVHLQATNQKIGEHAFYACSKNKLVSLPKNVDIGICVFDRNHEDLIVHQGSRRLSKRFFLKRKRKEFFLRGKSF